MHKSSVTLQDIYDEIGKCELLCRNCHNSRHLDVDRYNRLKPYIDHKLETYKEHKRIDYSKIKNMVAVGYRHCKIAKEIGCCQTTVRCAINRMKRKGEL